MKIYFIISIFLLLFISCAKNESVFSTKVSSEVGKLSITNTNGFIGATVSGSDFDQTLILKASGGLDINNISQTMTGDSEFTYKDGLFPGTGGNCVDTLKTGESCKIVVNFSPLDTKSYRTDIHFTFTDSLSTRTFNFILTADSHPILSFEYGFQYDFGNKFLGTTTTLRIKITNTGRVDAKSLLVNNPTDSYSFKGGSYPGVGGSCGTELNQGQSCEMIVNYSPLNRQQHLQNLTLNYLNAGRPETNTLILKGWGFLQASISFSASSGDDFGDVGNNFLHTKAYVVRYVDGDVAASMLNLSNIISPFSRAGGSCGTTISSGTCTIYIGLNSTVSGTWSNNISLSYHNGVELKLIDRTITGTTKEKPTLSLSTTVIDFGIVTKSSIKEIDLTVTYISGEIPATDIQLLYLNTPFTKVGGTCGTSLSSGSCTMKLRFSPTAYASYADNYVYFRYNNTETIVSIPLVFTGVSNANLYSYYGANKNFGIIVTNQITSKDIRLSYDGGAPATNISATITGGDAGFFTFTNGSYPGSALSSACGTTNTSADCFVYLTYAPTLAGEHSAILTLTYHDGISSHDVLVNLSGTATTAATLTATDVIFATTPLFSSSTVQYLTISNTSPMIASNLTMTLPAGFEYLGGTKPGSGGNCYSSLSAGHSCQLALIFRPLEHKTYNALLNIIYYDGTQNQIVTSTLSSTASISSDLFLSHYNLLTFNSTFEGDESSSISVTLGHGGGTVTASSISSTLDSTDFTIKSSTCTSLSTAQTCTINIAFTPALFGSKTAALNVSYIQDGQTKTVSRSLKGNSYETGKLESSPVSFDFGPRPRYSNYHQTITITKTSLQDVNIASRLISGTGFSFYGGSYPGFGGNCPISGPMPASCTVVVNYRATDYTTTTGALDLTYNNGYEIVHVTTILSGTGMPTSQLAFSPSYSYFGNVIQTQTKQMSITLTNNGSLGLDDFSIDDLSAPFHYIGDVYPGVGGTCVSSLDAGENCMIKVEFAPTTTGSFSKYILARYNNGYSNTTTSLSLAGVGIAQAIISLSEDDPFYFGSVTANQQKSQIFTLSNVGSVTATSMTGSFASTFNFTGASFPGENGTCTTSLLAGTTCDVEIEFSPTSANSFQGYFYLDYDDGVDTQRSSKELNGLGN